MFPVFYKPKMVAENRSYSPSAAKPKAVVASWMARAFPLELHEPRPLQAEEIALAHCPRMVDDILSTRRSNGFGNRSAEVAATLPYTSGSMYAAAVEALSRGSVAIAPCSGFHHAYYDAPSGFCTFNGLVISALLLRKHHRVRRVGILDFDEHYGNGTDGIIRKLQLGCIVHHTAGKFGYGVEAAETFLEGIPRILEDMRDLDCDVVLYQAGADPHVKDPLGGFLTTEQLFRRDRIVFESCRRLKLPVAWNLAGGYQVDDDGSIRPVLDIHDNTMRACVEVYSGSD